MKRPFPTLLWLLAGVVLLASCGSASPDELGTQPADRVLIVSLPGVGWDDLQGEDLPNLEAFVETAAIGDMSTRIGRRNATATDAYLTIGAGTRAVAPSVDVAVAVDPEDQYGGVPTAHILERRLGYVPGGIAYLASGAARDANDGSAFGAEVGLLGEGLEEAGVGRGVIANADALEGFIDENRPPDGYYARSAATALMGPDGIVPNGTVGRSLLADDPEAPFGRRLDHDAVMGYFDGLWGVDERQVVLVEASDIARASAYGARSTPEQRRALRSEALAASDELLGQLLEDVDPTRDAVMVLSPVSPSSWPALGMVALQAPDVDVGLLQSATTRRDGYVHLADVAPTVLTLLGEEFPTEMEGRSFQVGEKGTSGRVGFLVDSADAADFRDGFLPVLVAGIIVVIALLVLAMKFRENIPRWLRPVVVVVAFGILGAVPATFLAGQFGVAHASTMGHTAVVVGIAAVVAAVAAMLDRYRPGLGVVLAVGSTVVLIAGDMLFGARLQMNTVFGYSVAVAGRFTGLGNLAFALFGAAAVLLAVLVVERYGQRALGVAALMLTGVVLVDGLPMLGADVGGVLSLIPAFGVTMLILAGRDVGWRQAAALAGVAAATVLVFAFVDAARPAEAHTHLARFAEHVLDGRWELLFKNLNRRWQASFGSLQLAGWGTVLALLAVAWTYASVQERRRDGKPSLPGGLAWVAQQPTPTRAALTGLAVLGTVGWVANDSSLAVPLTMLIVAVPVLVIRTMSGSPPLAPEARGAVVEAGATNGDGTANGDGGVGGVVAGMQRT